VGVGQGPFQKYGGLESTIFSSESVEREEEEETEGPCHARFEVPMLVACCLPPCFLRRDGFYWLSLTPFSLSKLDHEE
jgi:hypothetical protein